MLLRPRWQPRHSLAKIDDHVPIDIGDIDIAEKFDETTDGDPPFIAELSSRSGLLGSPVLIHLGNRHRACGRAHDPLAERAIRGSWPC